jgi:hypothetical protein
MGLVSIISDGRGDPKEIVDRFRLKGKHLRDETLELLSYIDGMAVQRFTANPQRAKGNLWPRMS